MLNWHAIIDKFLEASCEQVQELKIPGDLILERPPHFLELYLQETLGSYSEDQRKITSYLRQEEGEWPSWNILRTFSLFFFFSAFSSREGTILSETKHLAIYQSIKSPLAFHTAEGKYPTPALSSLPISSKEGKTLRSTCEGYSPGDIGSLKDWDLSIGL